MSRLRLYRAERVRPRYSAASLVRIHAALVPSGVAEPVGDRTEERAWNRYKVIEGVHLLDAMRARRLIVMAPTSCPAYASDPASAGLVISGGRLGFSLPTDGQIRLG